MSLVTITLKVFDSVTNAPISGAQVFVNGTINFDPNQFTVATDANGMATFSVQSSIQNSGNVTVQVTATGYNPGGHIVNTLGFSIQTFSIPLVALPSPGNLINLQFSPAEGGITWQINATLDNGVSQNDGSATSNVSLTNGTYTITATKPGYQNASQVITVTGQTDAYTITLVATTDPSTVQVGNSSGSSSPLTSQPTNVLSQTNSIPPNQAEYIYPNTEYDKYFTIVGARMYIGNLFIDELNSVQFALQDNAVPVFGYSSRFFDALAQGRSMVQGQLTLNFVSEGYLYTVLRQYAQLLQNGEANTIIDNPGVDVVAQVLGLMAARNNLLQQQNNNPNSVLPSGPPKTLDTNTPSIQPGQNVALPGTGTTPETSPTITAVNQFTKANAITKQIQALTASMSPAQIDALNKQQEQQLTTFSDVIGFDNAIYQDVIFDIRIEFGNEITGVKRVRYLESCKLISNEQVLAQDGQTILDAYGFIARRLR